ncbi:hypothetical protein ACG7TL_005770 [Trametes sanguinea]
MELAGHASSADVLNARVVREKELGIRMSGSGRSGTLESRPLKDADATLLDPITSIFPSRLAKDVEQATSVRSPSVLAQDALGLNPRRSTNDRGMLESAPPVEAPELQTAAHRSSGRNSCAQTLILLEWWVINRNSAQGPKDGDIAPLARDAATEQRKALAPSRFRTLYCSGAVEDSKTHIVVIARARARPWEGTKPAPSRLGCRHGQELAERTLSCDDDDGGVFVFVFVFRKGRGQPERHWPAKLELENGRGVTWAVAWLDAGEGEKMVGVNAREGIRKRALGGSDVQERRGRTEEEGWKVVEQVRKRLTGK